MKIFAASLLILGFALLQGCGVPSCGLVFIEKGCSDSVTFERSGIHARDQSFERNGIHAKDKSFAANGVQFHGRGGSPVLAAAPGIVSLLEHDPSKCGNAVIINHPKGLYTVYCYLGDISIPRFKNVERGEIIGSIGISGRDKGSPHVSFRVNVDGGTRYPNTKIELEKSKDPMELIVGCFEPGKSYPDDESVLTYPVVCTQFTKVLREPVVQKQ